jgi:hypothetical protein
MVKKILLPLLLLSASVNAEIATEVDVTGLYVSVLDRAPSDIEIDYWIKTDMEIEDISSSIMVQPETEEKYPADLSIEDLIQNVYLNVFKRSPDSEGFDFWHKQLSTTDLTMSTFILSVVNGAQGDDEKLINNKTGVGLAFAKSKSKDLDESKAILEDVTADEESVTTVIKKFSLERTFVKITKEYKVQAKQEAETKYKEKQKEADKAQKEADKKAEEAKKALEEAQKKVEEAKKAQEEADKKAEEAKKAEEEAAAAVATQQTPSGSTTTPPSVTAPSLGSVTPSANFTVGTAITTIVFPSSGGAVTSCELITDITHLALPNGLTLNTTNCNITGTPTVATSGSVLSRVKGINSAGDSIADVHITVDGASTTTQLVANSQDVNATDANNTIKTITLTGVGSNLTFNILGWTDGSSEHNTTGDKGTLSNFNQITSTVQYISNINSDSSDSFQFFVSNGTDTNSTPVTVDINATVTQSTETSTPPSISDISGTQTYIKGVIITDLTFTNSGGDISSCSVTPTLPSGLSINSTTCTISGTPSELNASTSYEVNASNNDGFDTATVTIEVGNPIVTANALDVNLSDANVSAQQIQLVGTITPSNSTTLTYYIDTNTTNGTLSNFSSSAGTVDYILSGDSNITDSFTYHVGNGEVNSSIVTVDINATVSN